jgi:hypothetical protein
MSEIQAHCGTNNVSLDLKPRNAGLKPMCFQANKCPDGQTNLTALRDLQAILTMLHPGKLLEPAMVNLYLPGIQSGLLNGHIQAAGGPVFRVAVCNDRPKNP